MKKSLFLSTLIAAVALSTPAFADGNGTESDPYTGDIGAFTDIFDADKFPEGSTIYIDGITSGYFGNTTGSYTCVANIYIGESGMTFTNGYGGSTHTFTGDISGTGDWTFNITDTGTALEDCTFTGSLAGYSGDIYIHSGGSTDWFHFGNGGKAATDTNVSGTGSITITSNSGNGEIVFNYSEYANTESEAIAIGNSALTASSITFTGEVNYTVSSTISGNSGTTSTLTISNTGTTTITGEVSGINITVASSSTLAVGSTGTLDLSGATVDLGSTIQNSGTIIINTSTVFVLDNLTPTSGDVTSETGATYTLITNFDSGSVNVDTSSLGLSNVSSTHEIDSATFEYSDGVLKVTVIELEDGLHGSGSVDSPYYTSGSATITIPVSGDSNIFTAAGTTVYLATDEHSFGTASMQIYWSGEFTAACDIVIGAAGVYITDGSGGQSHKFTGAISGTGDFTVTHNGSQGSGVNQDYCFTGDLSQWSGNFTIDTTNANDYVCYGDGKTVAATATNVTGTGAISVSTGTVAFDYIKEDESGKTGPTTITIGNSSITATTLEFTGDVAYSLDLTKTAISIHNLTVGEEATLLIAGSGTITIGSKDYTVAIVGTLEVAEGVSFTLDKRTYTDASVGSLVLGSGSTFILYTQGDNPSSNSNGMTVGTLTVNGSATMETHYWHNYVSVGTLVGTNATLTLTSDAVSSVANIYEFGGSNTESSFTGRIVLSDSASGNRGLTLVISDEKIAAGAVIEMGAEGDNTDALALGVNAERVEIAGLVSSNSGGDIVYSGSVSLGATFGNQGATLADYRNQEGYGEGSAYDGVGQSTNTLVINTADNATYSFSGVFLDKVNIEKTGAGTQSIEFKVNQYQKTNFFDGSIAVNGGTLNLSGVAITSSGLTVAEGATLGIANQITLAEGSTSTIAGTVNIDTAIINNGSLTVSDGASFVIGNLTAGTYGDNTTYYVLVSGSGSVTIDGSISFTAGGSTDWSVYSQDGYLVIYGTASDTPAGQTSENLTWAGTDSAFTWNTDSTNAIWNDTETGASGYYFTDGNNVTFGAEGANTTVAVEGEVTAGSTTINGAYTFNIAEDASVTTGALTIADGGSLALTGSGTIVTGGAENGTVLAFNASDFTGEMDFTEGFLDIANSTFNEEATVKVTANTTSTDDNGYLTATDVSLYIGNAEDNSNSTFAASLELDGGGGVIIRTGNSTKTVTFSGSVTGESATLQINGGGSAVFSGEVNVGTYINYQGATTFTNKTTLSALEIYQAESNAGDVTFTGSDAQATVTAITVHATTGTSTATLTVSDGASLSVGTMAINDNFAITINNAAMSITTSVTQASGTSTSVTISNGGTLSLGSDVSLNVTAMEIILSTSDIASTNGVSPTADGTAILTGSGTLTSDAAIAITVDEALASVLGTEGTYTFDIYDSGLTVDNVTWDLSVFNDYGTASMDNGILTVVVGSGAIPEPSMFGVIFGLGALGLVATRRRRRKAA